MSSFATTSNDPQTRTQRRLLFEGFNIPDSSNVSRRHPSTTMVTSTPDHKLHEKEIEHLDVIHMNESQPGEPCLLQLQNARQLLHTMSRTNVLPINEPTGNDDQPVRTELFGESNPELAYYKSSLESERTRRKQLESLIDVQQQRLTETESELIQLRANDHKKTLCMKQLEQMIPNVVDEWKQKENEYKTKVNQLTQQNKQLEQTHREKSTHDKQLFDDQLNDKNLIIERLTKDNERLKQDFESQQSRNKQSDQRLQQLAKESEQAKQRWSTIESDLRNEIQTHESRLIDLRSELEKKQQDIEQMLRDQHKSNSDHQSKIRQLEHELDEQRRETNVLKMELELREAKYRAQTESLKIQLLREAETKLAERLEEQHNKHLQIEDELNELHRRKLADLESKHEQILSHDQQEHENRVQILVTKLDQMKEEIERIQSTTIAERHDLAKKLQDVFETALFKGSTKLNLPLNELPTSSSNNTPREPPPPPPPMVIKPQVIDPQMKIDYPNNISTIRSLSTRIDSLVDQTNRVANGFELSSRLPATVQTEISSDWIEQNSNRLLASQPTHSALQSPYFRSTPIDPMQDWHPTTSLPSNNNHLTNRSRSADPTNHGLFSTYPSYLPQPTQQSSSNSFSLDSHLNSNHYYQSAMPSHRSTSSLTTNFLDHQQDVQPSLSKDSIERTQNDQISSNNQSLTKYVKMLLERSPTQDHQGSKKHPLAKTNRSLHDIQLSLEQINSSERNPKMIVDDLVAHHQSENFTPRQHQSSNTSHPIGAKKRLDYDAHNHKQSNNNQLFERLSQPKTRMKKDKIKQQQQQQHTQSSTTGAWK